MKKISSLLFLLAFTATCLAQRNVVLIIADDLGTDYLGFYEDFGDTAAMPNIRSLLKNGVRFTNAMSNPICSPTRAGILTGRYSFRTGVGTAVGGTNGGPSLPMTETTLPQILEAFQPNIQKANLGKWHLHGPQPANLLNPNLLGYDHYSGLFIGALPDYFNWTKITNGVSAPVTNYATTETANDAISWTTSQTNPFFLWLAFNAPHSPFHLPPAGLHSYTNLSGTAADIAANPKPYFKASIEALDHEIGRLFDSLKAQNRFDSTDFIFIGDNGNAMQTAQIANISRSKGTIYQYGVHIPMIISGPSVVNPGRVSDALVNTVDLFATILELFGDANWAAQIPADKPVDSQSLLPILNDECEAVRPWVFTEIFKPTTDEEDGKAVRNRDFKLLDFDDGHQEFYNLAADPNELDNLLPGPLNANETANFNFLSNEMKQLTGPTNPVISAWLRNLTGIKGRHYLSGNPTPIQDNTLANIQSVSYSANWAYVQATGIPAYITGPFLDGNPSIAQLQTGFFKFPLNPVQNTGTPTATTGGNIGAFINGVALFDYRDGVAWNTNTNALCGGPGNPPCPGGPMATQAWNRDAVPAERDGFDCAKGHPAMGNYHHHQNPSAFNLDLAVISNICDVYLADGLYTIDSTKHSPLIGFAYDGFPIYGAYGFKNTDGTGGITRIKSGYKLRNITVRTHHADGTNVADGPPVSTTYPLGYFREDYEFVAGASDVLDVHNGRFCVTPEYPQGIYAYFATVNEAWNSAYPYAVGPTFYGTKTASKVATITETVTTYNGEPLAAEAISCQNDCFGGENGTITLFVNGGNPPYSFNWGGGITDQNRTGLAAGNYAVTITDAAGQTATQTATVTQPATGMSASATATDVACSGNSTGEIELTITGGSTNFSFLWSDGATTQNRSNLPAGIYWATITDSKSCTATVSQTISQPQMALSATANSIAVDCFGNSTGEIQLTANGGTAGYSFFWNDGENAQNRSNLAAGVYTATITDAKNCTTTISETVSQPQTALSATANSTPIDCFGNSTGEIQLTANGGTAGYSFFWNDGETTQNRSNLAAGVYSVTITDAKNCTATITQTVSQPQTALSVSSVSMPVACFGNSTGEIQLTADGGSPGYSFTWNDGETGQNRSNLPAGFYSATVSDANNCSTSISENITQPDKITASTTPSNATCGETNGSVLLAVSGGIGAFSFVWSNGSTAQNPDGLAAGSYFVTMTDSNGCAENATAQVSNENGPTASLTALSVACFGEETGELTLEIASGTPPFSFIWNDGATAQNRQNLPSGDWFVSILDANDCLTIASQTISQPAEISLTGTSMPDACDQSTGSILMEIEGGTAPFSFAWSHGSTVQNPANLPAGDYQLSILDANGCAAQFSTSVISLAAPDGSATVTPVGCFGEMTGAIELNVQNGTPPFSFEWSNGATAQNLDGLAAGPFSVTILDANGCTSTVYETVSQPANPLSVISEIENVGCFGGNSGSINLSASGGTAPFSFIWNDGNTAQIRPNLTAGQYSATISDANGCTSSVAENVAQPDSLFATSAPTQIACFGDSTGSIEVNPAGGTPPFSFIWNDGLTSQNRPNLPAGTYFATISDANGCTAVGSEILTGPFAALSLTTSSTPSTAANDGTAEAIPTGGTPPYSFEWSNGFSGSQPQNLPAGTYLVTITDANFCTTTGSATVDFISSAAVILGNIALNVFPNPTSDLLIVQANGLLKNSLHLKLAAANGQILLKNELPAGSTICVFDTQTLYEGIYFLTVSDGVSVRTLKVVVCR